MAKKAPAKPEGKKPKGGKGVNPFAKGKAKAGKCPSCGKDLKDCKCKY